MTESLLRLDGIARSYRQTQAVSLTSFRALHSAVRDISARSNKIREATRAHLRALTNVTRTEVELHTAVQSYTIPDWLARVGESCSKHTKGDVPCSTHELCKAMERLVVSKAYLDCKPWNPVADALQGTVDRYVKAIVAVAEDRVLLRFMHAVNSSGGATMAVASAGGESSQQQKPTQNAGHQQVLFGPPGAAAVEMGEVTELLSALFKNYNRIRAVQEVKAFILDQIYSVLQARRAECRRETAGDDADLSSGAAGAAAGSGGGAFSFFASSSQMMGTGPERLGTALRDLIASCHRAPTSSSSSSSSSATYADAFSSSPSRGVGQGSSFFGSRDDADCVFNVSVAARSLCLDANAFLERYVLAAVPPPPKRRTATQVLLGSGKGAEEDENGQIKAASSSSLFEEEAKQMSRQNADAEDSNEPPVDPEVADEIDLLRAALLTVPAEIVEMTASYALDILAKLITDIAVKQPYALHTVPVRMLEAVQEAWHWRHTCRMVAGDTSNLRVIVDDKVDTVMQLVFDNFANLRDEPSNLTYQTFLDLMLGDEATTYAALPYDLLFLTGVRAYADKNPKVMDERVGKKFRRAVWHPERDTFFGFAPPVIEALRRMVAQHEATLHVVFAGSVSRADTLIQKADAAIAVQQSKLVKEARKRSAASRRGVLQPSSFSSSSSPADQHQQQQQQSGGSGGGGGGGRTAQSDFSALTARAAIDAEGAARDVFEFVRSDIEDFFVRSVRGLITWASAAATAAFLLHHAEFEEDEHGEMTSRCLDTEETLLWTKVPPGKLRFHPALFRANTIQKIMNRLSSSGVFDVDLGQQLMWTHHSNNNNSSNLNQSQGSSAAMLAAFTAPASVAAALSMFSPEGAASAFTPAAAAEESTPSFSSGRASGGGRQPPSAGAATSIFEADPSGAGTGDDALDIFSSVPKPKPAASSSALSAGNGAVKEEPWRQKLLDTLLNECRELLDQEVELVASRWATILPEPQGEHWDGIAASSANDPLTHDQRQAVKEWYWAATNALYSELELWEGGGVVAVEDPGLRAALGAAAVNALRQVLEEVEVAKLKRREWSTRPERWMKIPRSALESCVRAFQLPTEKP